MLGLLDPDGDDASAGAFQVLTLRQSGKGRSKTQARPYKKRRPHSKTKRGCLSCKAKRVKCDEAKGTCKRCHRNGIVCVYPAPASPESHPESQSETSGGSISPPTRSLSPYYPELPEQGVPFPAYGTPRWELLHHFSNAYLDILEVPPAPVEELMKLALSRTFLLDSVLAVAACHLRHHAGVSRPHKVAEHFQQSLALRSFQTALSQPLDDPRTADALLACCIMLSLLSWSSIESSDPMDTMASWVFSDSTEDRLSWFWMQTGVKHVLAATTDFREGSMMASLYQMSARSEAVVDAAPLSRVPPAWLRLCGPPDELGPGSPFYGPLKILSISRLMKPIDIYIYFYLQFVGRLDQNFRALMNAKDDRVMWLVGYWLGLMCRFDRWWLRIRMRREYRAICQWLERRRLSERPGDEGLMWRDLMAELASAPQWVDPKELG